jgi:hypothetical protein
MTLIAELPIRYDGKDAEQHRIELHLLGESLQGVARILGVTGHFVATGQYAKQLQALDVKVLVGEPQANCVTLSAALEFARDHQLFAGGFGTVLGVILTWLFARASNNAEEMKAIKDSLDKAIDHLAGQNAQLVPRLLSTLEKLADSLSPALRASVAPVGKTCSTMRIGDGPVIDEATAEAIRSTSADELTDERTWTIYITELDWETNSAKIRFVDDVESDLATERRYKDVIKDPAIGIVGNVYLVAFASQATLSVRAKATLRNGEVQTLYISDTVQTA